MRIGNLSQARIRSRNTFAFQMVRVLVVVTIAASGALALSLSVEDEGASPDLLAAERPHDGTETAAVQAIGQPARNAPVQVATADPLTAAPMDGGGIPSAAAPAPSVEEPVQASAAAPAPAPAPAGPSGDQAAAPSPAPSADAPAPEAQQAAPAAAPPPEEQQAASASAPPPPVDAEMTGAVTVAGIPDDPDPANGLVDLNTASFEQLNSLRNAGPIGRAIIRHRPYASVEELVKRKILRRSVYEKIKDQVTVR